MSISPSPEQQALGYLADLVAERLRDDDRVKPVGKDDVLRGLTNIGKYLHCSHVTVERLIREEGLPARKVGSEWRASRRALSTWCEGDRVSA